MGLFRPLLRPDSLEDVFLERYGDLLRAALAITGGRREAEDLVHDAFVRLMLAQPDLASIEHLDAYLRTVLRNLHTARLRRLAHRMETPLSIADFDSAQFAARALTPSQWTQARHDVAAACRYACTRRLTSKTGSLFLLRFVHELVPSDIARISRMTRDTVDITLLRARAEVKGYLEQPLRALQSLEGGLVSMPMPAVDPGADDDHDYLARVREAVFALRHARCIEPERLQALYAAGSGSGPASGSGPGSASGPAPGSGSPSGPAPGSRSASSSKSANGTAIPMEILAEIVTCPRCLDRVSRLTQVPLGTEPPPDADTPSQDAPPTSPLRLTTRDARHGRRAAAEQACRAVRAHRPHLLRVFVNGFEVATHEISGGAARVTQTISATEPVWLIEIYSEQEVCLASLDVAPLPEAAAEQGVTVALADDRKIELALSFLRPWPTLRLVYEDPAYATHPAVIDARSDEQAEALQPRLDAIAPAPASPTSPASPVTPAAPAAPAVSPAPDAPPARGLFLSWKHWVLGAPSEPSEPSAHRRPPRLAWLAVTTAVIGWLLFFTPGTPVSAAERLWRALSALVGGGATTPTPMPSSGPARQKDITLPPAPKPRGAVSSPTPAALTPTVLAELEIDALTTLHARHALTGQRIQVTRTPASVAVEGLVEGRDRQELVRALREVPHGAALRVNLSTPEDLLGTRTPGGTGTPSPSGLRAVTLGKDALPAADDLRRAIAARGPAAVPNVEAEVHRMANDGLRYARTAFLEAATLSTLADRFDAARASGMSEGTSTKWKALLGAQADQVAREVDRVRTLLEPVFRGAAGATPGATAGSTAGSTLAPAAADQSQLRPGDEARRIAEELREAEAATRAALAVAEIAPTTIELREREFWRRLAATSERIAAFSRHVTR